MFFPLNLILRLIQHQILVKFSSISELTISRSRPNLINVIQALRFSHPKTYSNIPRKTLTLPQNMKILQKPSNSVSIACHFSVNLTMFNIQKICINSQKKLCYYTIFLSISMYNIATVVIFYRHLYIHSAFFNNLWFDVTFVSFFVYYFEKSKNSYDKNVHKKILFVI